jgi:hypothetical protein
MTLPLSMTGIPKVGFQRRKQFFAIIASHNLDCMINTDQTGCKYHIDTRPSLL